MIGKKTILPLIASLASLASGAASAHPAGHGELSMGELLEHLGTSAFHIGVIVAAITIGVLLYRLHVGRTSDKSEASHE